RRKPPRARSDRAAAGPERRTAPARPVAGRSSSSRPWSSSSSPALPPRRRRALPLPGQRDPLSLSIASSVSRGRVTPLAEELVERPVDLVGVGPGDGVWAAFDGDQLHVLDQAGQALA